jgi:hypothetical protein
LLTQEQFLVRHQYDQLPYCIFRTATHEIYQFYGSDPGAIVDYIPFLEYRKQSIYL